MSDGLRRCDQCGRDVVYAHRIYRGEIYCTTCYYREFKNAPCPKCGKKARLHRQHPECVCRRCEYKDVPCVRCGRIGRAIGKITEYGPVCGSCAVYFREAKTCEGCGKLSLWVNRSKRSGTGLMLCEICRGRLNGVCEMCGRHRKLQKHNGRLVCKKCAVEGYAQCPTCKQLMPAGFGKICGKCATTERLEKRVTLCQQAFKRTSTAEMFGQYATWLVRRVGVEKACLTINKYLGFFAKLEEIPEGELSSEALLQKFGTLGLRRSLLPTRFLEQEKVLVVSAKAKDLAADLLCIWRYRNAFSVGSDEWLLVNAYADYLAERVVMGHLTVRSARLASGVLNSRLTSAQR